MWIVDGMGSAGASVGPRSQITTREKFSALEYTTTTEKRLCFQDDIGFFWVHNKNQL